MKKEKSIRLSLTNRLAFNPVFIALFILFAFAACQQKSRDKIAWDPAMANSLDALQKDFEHPGVDFSTTPFWVWNDEVSKEQVDMQLRDFKSHGISMVIIHPRPGLITEYLSRDGSNWYAMPSIRPKNWI
ncbi:MAG: hypothetical protein HC819_16350 [Cyclobacteriaceae bacterium]|nr:hypothetical protein [Cyclobacteriaceae bacterium]